MSLYDTLDEFTQAYITCALWSSCDDAGDPFDNNYDPDDIGLESIRQMIKDCQDFREYAKEELTRCGLDEGRQGHDFWLTRNGHGAGFWDEGLKALGEELTSKAHSFGSCDLYIGDDGLIYCT